MRATGIVRMIDDLGRIVIPKEIRRACGLREGDGLVIFIENNSIVLTKHTPQMDLIDQLLRLKDDNDWCLTETQLSSFDSLIETLKVD